MKALGDTYRLDSAQVTADVDALIGTRILRADTVIRGMRQLADRYESEVAAFRDLRDRESELVNSETHLFEGAVTEFGQLRVIHDSNSRIGMISRILRKLLRGTRKIVSRGHETSLSVDGQVLDTPDAVAKTVQGNTDSDSFGTISESAGPASRGPALAEGGHR